MAVEAEVNLTRIADRSGPDFLLPPHAIHPQVLEVLQGG